MADRKVFVWATGQLDNLGDSVLRRPYLDALRQLGAIHVWTKDAGRDFLSGMGVQDSDSLIVGFRRWVFRALASAVLQPTYIALNAGEVPVSRRGAARIASILPIALIARLRGGGLVWVGAGIPRSDSKLWSVPYRWAGRLAKPICVRDRESLATIPSAQVLPDWAFALGSPTSTWAEPRERRTIVVSLRGDRPFPPKAWIEWVSAQAASKQLEIVCLSQVQRDNQRARELQIELGGKTVLFESGDHAEHEVTVRSIYGESLVTISDRLHVLILASTEGSRPFGWVATSKGKIGRHFEAVGMGEVASFEGAAPVHLPSLPDVSDLGGLRHTVDSARNGLSVISDRLAALDV